LAAADCAERLAFADCGETSSVAGSETFLVRGDGEPLAVVRGDETPGSAAGSCDGGSFPMPGVGEMWSMADAGASSALPVGGEFLVTADRAEGLAVCGETLSVAVGSETFLVPCDGGPLAVVRGDETVGLPTLLHRLRPAQSF
jgi:hypothetical protein